MKVSDATALIRTPFIEWARPQSWCDLRCGSGTFTTALAQLLASAAQLMPSISTRQRWTGSRISITESRSIRLWRICGALAPSRRILLPTVMESLSNVLYAKWGLRLDTVGLRRGPAGGGNCCHAEDSRTLLHVLGTAAGRAQPWRRRPGYQGIDHR
jgi:hypothetical protein